MVPSQNGSLAMFVMLKDGLLPPKRSIFSNEGDKVPPELGINYSIRGTAELRLNAAADESGGVRSLSLWHDVLQSGYAEIRALRHSCRVAKIAVRSSDRARNLEKIWRKGRVWYNYWRRNKIENDELVVARCSRRWQRRAVNRQGKQDVAGRRGQAQHSSCLCRCRDRRSWLDSRVRCGSGRRGWSIGVPARAVGENGEGTIGTGGQALQGRAQGKVVPVQAGSVR